MATVELDITMSLDGCRLVGDVGTDAIDLEQIRVADAPGITHVRYRVVK